MDELEKIRKEKLKKLMDKMKEIEIEVSDENFDEKVIEKSKEVPVIVDFWATWCPPCVMLSPILEKLAKEYNGKLILAKLNVDKNPQTSMRYGIMSIPAVKMFKNGKIVDEFIGLMPEDAVRKWIERNIK